MSLSFFGFLHNISMTIHFANTNLRLYNYKTFRLRSTLGGSKIPSRVLGVASPGASGLAQSGPRRPPSTL